MPRPPLREREAAAAEESACGSSTGQSGAAGPVSSVTYGSPTAWQACALSPSLPVRILEPIARAGPAGAAGYGSPTARQAFFADINFGWSSSTFAGTCQWPHRRWQSSGCRRAARLGLAAEVPSSQPRRGSWCLARCRAAGRSKPRPQRGAAAEAAVSAASRRAAGPEPGRRPQPSAEPLAVGSDAATGACITVLPWIRDAQCRGLCRRLWQRRLAAGTAAAPACCARCLGPVCGSFTSGGRR